jgi:hypothetical protein
MLWTVEPRRSHQSRSAMKDVENNEKCLSLIPLKRNQKIPSKYSNWQLLSTEFSKVESFQGATDIVTHNERSKLVLFVKGLLNWRRTI